MNEEKMSKSIGNVKLVHELRQEHDPQVLRFFLATAHYRRPINYSEAAIHEANKNLNRIKTAIENADYRLEDAKEQLPSDNKAFKDWDKLKADFIEDMDDDFQAQNGITDIYEMVRLLNVYLEGKEVSKAVINYYTADLQELLAIFGIENLKSEKLLNQEIDDLIVERNEARAAKDFERADQIRDDLKDQGIVLEDTPQGIRWRRVDN